MSDNRESRQAEIDDLHNKLNNRLNVHGEHMRNALGLTANVFLTLKNDVDQIDTRMSILLIVVKMLDDILKYTNDDDKESIRKLRAELNSLLRKLREGEGIANGHHARLLELRRRSR